MVEAERKSKLPDTVPDGWFRMGAGHKAHLFFNGKSLCQAVEADTRYGFRVPSELITPKDKDICRLCLRELEKVARKKR